MRPRSAVTKVDVTTATFAQSHHYLQLLQRSFALSRRTALQFAYRQDFQQDDMELELCGSAR